ncbi:MAG TPA: glucosyl-3-phosphoglycerate synthase [Chloroflexota bacterium]|nr:glucosyl-3-phosphoglycerate synthase [Chloroflexota bacterium]
MLRSADKGYTIMVPLSDMRSAGDMIKMAGALVPPREPGRRGRVVALGIVEIPEEADFSRGVRPAQAHRQRLGRIFKKIKESPDLEIATVVRVSRQLWQGIADSAREERCDLLMLPWKGSTATPNSIFGTTIDEIVKDPPCDVALVKRQPMGSCKRILLPVRGGPHAALALQLAVGLAERYDGSVTALRVIPPGLTMSDVEQEKEQFNEFLAGTPSPRVGRVFKVSESVIQAILSELPGHDFVAMGASAAPASTEPYLFGSIAERVVQESDRPVIVVKTKQQVKGLKPDWGRLFQEERSGRTPMPISTVVDKWFAENTFDSEEWSDLDMLVRLKRSAGVTISLGLPALNEEATVGPIIQSIKTELMDRHPLLDEMVLIDSDSTDRTAEIARGLGIPVYTHPEILPRYGTIKGKGEALWKSLYVLKGDIIAWIDTDIRNIHPRFVYGLLGPLLAHPSVKYVKGFYRRPIRVGHKTASTGGGRVTELTARPMLNLFYPELSGVVQPLAGEYAGRRDALERLPFFTGYGVETGMLIDFLDAYGLHAIGQVDLKKRVHRNQSLVSLSKMAFTLIQVVLKRVEDQQRLRLLTDLNPSMKMIQHDRDHFYLDVKELMEQERPPMISVPEYRKLRGLA